MCLRTRALQCTSTSFPEDGEAPETALAADEDTGLACGDSLNPTNKKGMYARAK